MIQPEHSRWDGPAGVVWGGVPKVAAEPACKGIMGTSPTFLPSTDDQ